MIDQGHPAAAQHYRTFLQSALCMRGAVMTLLTCGRADWTEDHMDVLHEGSFAGRVSGCGGLQPGQRSVLVSNLSRSWHEEELPLAPPHRQATGQEGRVLWHLQAAQKVQGLRDWEAGFAPSRALRPWGGCLFFQNSNPARHCFYVCRA